MRKLSIFSFALFTALFLSGCYTELLVDPMGEVSRSNSDTTYTGTTNVRVAPCNCTPWEIETATCWCTCDRCGLFHRVGYDFCPSGIYRSYGGWDYFDRVPWWKRHRRSSSFFHNNSGNYRPTQNYNQPQYNTAPRVTTPSKTIIVNQERPSKNRNGGSTVVPVTEQPKQLYNGSVPLEVKNNSTDTLHTEPQKIIQMRERPSKNRN